MQTDKNEMKIEKSVSMHSHAFKRPCKHQIVIDPKSHNASHIFLLVRPRIKPRRIANRDKFPEIAVKIENLLG